MTDPSKVGEGAPPEETAAGAGEEPSGDPPGEPLPNGWHEITINTSFHVLAPRPCWVIKIEKRYVRVPTIGKGVLMIADQRFATRFDSSMWAATIAGSLRGARIVRLWNKAEREIQAGSKKAADGSRRFTFRGETPTPARADGQPIAPEGAASEATAPKAPATTTSP